MTALSPADGLVRDLRAALASGEGLHLAFQPKFDLFRRRITGVEALVRWSHPARGAIPPVAFVPVAEANGLIAPLGGFVLREACRQAARWRAEGLPLQVAVNVSPLQFVDGFEAEVDRALADHRLPPDALEIEVTEGVLMDGGSRSRLDDLTERGVGIAIDDFGTGYSSLAYLKRLKASTLKIDKSFIDGLPGSLDDCMLVGSVIRLAHSFGMMVVAEGVEIPDQIEVLDLLECDLVQGYAISRPVPAAEIPALLTAALP